jgi:hypothetical protein
LIEQTRLRQKINESKNSRAQITQQTHMQIQQQKYSKRAQLVHNNKMGQYLNYRQLIRDPKHKEIWSTSAANVGRLSQGVGGRVKGTNTIFFICKDQVPKDRIKDATYGSYGCEIKPNKEEKHCMRLTAGGDRIHYPDNVGTPTANITLVKVLLNSIISTENMQCIILEMKDFYLNTPMTRFKYMQLKLNDISEEIIFEYKLREIVTKGRYVYCKIQKGMYSLPQAGIIVQDLLQAGLAKVGYHQSKIIPGLWTHETRKTCFTLVVDDFAIKYTSREDAQHLIDALKQDHTITIDWDATKYIGLTLKWDYKNQMVYAHMPGYIQKANFHLSTKHQQQNRTHHIYM